LDFGDENSRPVDAEFVDDDVYFAH
jgi:hypothetical protein